MSDAMMMYALIAAGLFLLFVGGEILVRGSVGVARKFGVSELVIGAVLVGFGTSMPELVTSLRAVGQGAEGVAVGNVAGSNIANILLVLGVAALIRPILTKPSALARDLAILVLATIAFGIIVYYDGFSRLTGILLTAGLLAYVAYTLISDMGSDSDIATMHADEGGVVEVQDPLPLAILLTVGGIIGVILGAHFLVDGAVDLARSFNVSEAVIGLTIVAIGTSLPELATSVVSAMRGKSDVAVGNVIGSSIFNILGILGITALVKPFSVYGSPPVGPFDDPAAAEALSTAPMLTWGDMGALILAVFLLILFAFTGKRLARWEGAVMLGAYGLYMLMLFGLVPTPFATA